MAEKKNYKKGKTYEEIYGKEKAELIKKRMSENYKALNKNIKSKKRDSVKAKRKINKDGYLFFNYDYKRYSHHNFIWLRENTFGYNFIPEGWVVHHRNLNKLDNRIENLIIVPNGFHVKIHAQLKRGEI